MEATRIPMSVEEAEKLRKKQFERNKWFFTTSGIGRDLSYNLISTFLLVYIQFGVSLTLAQFTTLSFVIGVGGRIWDALNDPIMGAIIEGSHLKAGKFRPWILLGALTCGIVIMLMFGIQSIAGWKFVVFMSIMYLLWESTFTVNDISYWAMLPSLSSDKKERNTLTALTVLFAGIGAIISQGVTPILTVGDARAGYRTVAIATALIFMASQLMTFLFVKEPPRRGSEKQASISLKKMWQTIIRNDQILWMTLSQLYYNVGSNLLVVLSANLLYLEIGYNGTLYFYVVVAYGVTTVAVNIIYPWLAGLLGRRKLQVWSIAACVVGYAFIGLMGWTGLLPFNIALLCLFCVLISAGQSLFYMASVVNMTNCVEYNDFKFGERNEAVVSTLRPFMAKFASAMQTLVVTIVLAISGTFLLSQSISTLETQRDFFARMDSPSAQAHYIEAVQDYIGEYDGLAPSTGEYDAVAAKIAERIGADETMSTVQLDAQYVPALAEAMVLRTPVDASGAAAGKAEELGRLKDIDASSLASGGSYAYALEVGDLKSGQESAANLNFRDKSTLSMRVWLRVAVTVLPILLLILSLDIQKRKFIIDEDYYDMMVETIKARDN